MDSLRIVAVTFERSEDFREEWTKNIANGGIFVPTVEAFELREPVRVGIELAYCSRSVLVEAEVVHVVGAELAGSGAVPGVALQFAQSGEALRRTLEPLAGAIELEQQAPDTDERRDSSRGPARVPALLRLPGDQLVNGLTRDLSRSGVLFAFDDACLAPEDLPRGAHVTLFLQDQETLADRVIPGVVARRIVTREGALRALGLRFGPPERLDDATRAFLQGLREREHSRNLGALRGAIEAGGCADLVDTLARSSRAGTLALTRGDEEGHLAFRDHQLVGARLGAARGPKALARLLSWTEGSWHFHARVDAERFADGERPTPLPLEAALLDALRRLGDLSNMQLPPPAARLRASGGETGDLDKVEGAILDLAAVGERVGRLVDVVPEPDLEVYRAIASLRERGLVSLEE